MQKDAEQLKGDVEKQKKTTKARKSFSNSAMLLVVYVPSTNPSLHHLMRNSCLAIEGAWWQSSNIEVPGGQEDIGSFNVYADG